MVERLREITVINRKRSERKDDREGVFVPGAWENCVSAEAEVAGMTRQLRASSQNIGNRSLFSPDHPIRSLFACIRIISRSNERNSPSPSQDFHGPMKSSRTIARDERRSLSDGAIAGSDEEITPSATL
jgi:hypothetical protein